MWSCGNKTNIQISKQEKETQTKQTNEKNESNKTNTTANGKMELQHTREKNKNNKISRYTDLAHPPVTFDDWRRPHISRSQVLGHYLQSDCGGHFGISWLQIMIQLWSLQFSNISHAAIYLFIYLVLECSIKTRQKVPRIRTLQLQLWLHGRSLDKSISLRARSYVCVFIALY